MTCMNKTDDIKVILFILKSYGYHKHRILSQLNTIRNIINLPSALCKTATVHELPTPASFVKRRIIQSDTTLADHASYWSSASALGKYVYRTGHRSQALNLTPLLEKHKIASARKLSAVDPTLFAGVESHSGYFNVNKTGKYNTFFWYFPATKLPLESTPLVIWLQGGPGGSSLYGLFNEIGPIQINKNGDAERMPISWASSYSLLFIDNPVGTGFSYSDLKEYVSNEDMVGACLLNFMQQFLDVFTELRKAPLFIAGESYAGKYIPAFGHYIHKYKDVSKPINLRGLAIGNGWIDPPSMLHYSEWALQVGLVDNEQAAKIKEDEDRARVYLKQKYYRAYAKESENAFTRLLTYAPVSFYNYLKDEGDDDNMDDVLVAFLRRRDIQAALHVGYRKYNAMDTQVYLHLYNDMYSTVKPWLEELLEHYGVMCYNGQLDVIVGYALSVHTYRSLKWSGQQQYLKANRKAIYDEVDDTKINSFLKTSGNFMDVMVRGAGHMVPADKPRAAKQMLDMFIGKFK